MPPPPRRLLALTSILLPLSTAEAPLLSRAPIGPWQQVALASSRCSARRSRVEDARRWSARTQHTLPTGGIGGGRRRSFQSTWERQHGNPKRSNTAPLLAAVFGVTGLAYLGSKVASHTEQTDDSIHVDDSVDIADTGDDEKIRLAEVVKHDRHADSQWVIRGTNVYDITDFIEQHPGGEVILRACGGSIDPYWKIIAIHQKQEVYDMLAQFHIGELDNRDLDEEGKVNWKVLGEDAHKYIVEDPFQHDPERDASLIYRTAKPCNAETPGSMLTDFVTPLRLFFVRNHLWVPQTHESPKAITIELSDGEEVTYSLEELKAKFQEHTITATLQCAGNRRSHMSDTVMGKTSGLQWDVGAIGTANFSGCRLRDVLRESGCDVEDDCPTPTQCDSDEDDKHVHFISPGDTYAASIPLYTALNPQSDVLIAWDMNGEPLNRDHGGPLRAIVPGTTAARSVKWLGRISVSTDESPSQHQQRDYKLFGPNRRQAEIRTEEWDEAQSIQETPVQSAITNIIPANGDNKTTVKGWAFSGGGRRIVRVDVSADGGKTWKQAVLQKDKAHGSRRWAWTLWKIQWPKDELKPGEDVEFVVKASDDSYNTQPQSFDSIWNFRGLLANAWHRQTRPYAEI